MIDEDDEFLVERVLPSDLDAILSASRALFADEGVEPPAERAHRITLYRRLERDAEALVFRRRAGEAPVAFALVSRTGPRSARRARIEQFRVEPEVRRRGWGRRCIEALLAGPLAGAAGVEVRVLDDNVPAIAFWRSLGFGTGDRSLAIEPRPPSPPTLSGG